MSSMTRERIIDQAMHLFSQHGYAATSVAKIEAAAGIERQIARLDAFRELRVVFTALGDLKAELTLIARYILTELDSESDLLRILASEARNRPQLLTAAVDKLISSTFEGFATWIGERAERPIPN